MIYSDVLSRKVGGVQTFYNCFNFEAMTDFFKWDYPGICKSVPFKNLHPCLKTEGVIEFVDTENPYFPYCTNEDMLTIENCKNLNNAVIFFAWFH